MNSQEIAAHLIAHAEANPAFREALLADPRAALASLTGAPLPADLQVTVLQQTPQHLYLVLPSSSEELSENELETLAGGFDFKESFIKALENAKKRDEFLYPRPQKTWNP